MNRNYIKIDKKIVQDIKNKKISSITQILEKVTKNSIFICIKGSNFDSHLFVKEAFKRGAKYVIGTQKLNLKNYFCVNNSRKALSYLLNIFYCFPDKKIKIIGVVGTNGKTSTTYIFKDFCQNLGIKYGVIGTNGIYINDNFFDAKLTTPDSEELFYYLNKMVKEKIEYLIMEISAHAIKLDKVFSLKFSRLIFTNFSQDHLDFFKTIKEYQTVKEKIFLKYSYEKAIINSDDFVGNNLFKIINKDKISYGKSGEIALKQFQLNPNYSLIELFTSQNYKIKLPLPCEYNIYNYLAVFSTFLSYGYNENILIEKTHYLNKLKGRFQVINFLKTHKIIVDYAHTPLSTQKTLQAVKNYFPNNYLITMFGCPGNREQEKRSLTGRIVSKYSDLSIITSDNPNFENPIKIISQIKKGISNKYIIIEDRQEALKKAVEIFLTKKNCVLLLLGKGIEEYQLINNVKIPYNEENELKRLLEF